MKKEDFIKLGLTEEQALACESASTKELEKFVPKTRFDEVNIAKNTLEANAKTFGEKLNDLQKANADNETLKSQIGELQKTNDNNKADYEKQIRDMQVSQAVDIALVGAKAKNSLAAQALLNLTDAKITETGEIEGLKEQIEALQKDENTSFLFESATPNLRGATPADGGDTSPEGNKDEKMTYEQACAHFAQE